MPIALPKSPSRPSLHDVPEVSVRAAHGGWDLCVECNGRLVVAGHHSGWHRIERGRTLLEQQIIAVRAPARRQPCG